MVNTDFVRTILGVIGNIISFGLFASPAPTFWTIFQRKDVEQFSPNPYLATVLNCAMWVFYGLPMVHPHSILVVTINGIGLLVEFVYVFIYFKYANKKQRRYILMVLAIEVVVMAAVVPIVLSVCHTHDERSMVVGILCIVFNICMYGMPLDVMRLVIKTKSVEYMPIYLVAISFVNGCIWVSYAQLRFDLYMTISNGVGAVLCLVQLIIYACYYKSTPKRDDKSQVQLSSGDGKFGSPV